MQTSARPASGLGLLDSYTPLGGNQTRLYYALREAVPIIDAAIFKTVRLTGGFESDAPTNACSISSTISFAMFPSAATSADSKALFQLISSSC